MVRRKQQHRVLTWGGWVSKRCVISSPAADSFYAAARSSRREAPACSGEQFAKRRRAQQSVNKGSGSGRMAIAGYMVRHRAAGAGGGARTCALSPSAKDMNSTKNNRKRSTGIDFHALTTPPPLTAQLCAARERRKRWI